jgi:hypothetical protein
MPKPASFYAPNDTETHLYVVYDQETGEIAYTHHLALLEGAKMPSKSMIDKLVLSPATRNGKPLKRMAILQLGKKPLKPNTAYYVDVKSHTLVEHGGIISRALPDSARLFSSRIGSAAVVAAPKSKRSKHRD